MQHDNERQKELPGGISYRVIFASRRTISIIVSPHKGVIVRAPHRTPLRTIESFVSEKSGWIRKHLREHSELINMNTLGMLKNGDTIPYLGELLPVKVIPGDELYVRSDGNSVEIGIKQDTGAELMIKILKTWYRRRAEKVFPHILQRLLNKYEEYDFSPTALTVRILKTRWGSCSRTGRITLNSELLRLSEKYIEYVIIHELCHLKHHNHGKDFYALLAELCPDYKAIKRELGKYIAR
jgi:hypothetical protein